MNSTDDQTTGTAREDMTDEQIAASHRMLDKLDAICEANPGVAATNLAALTANYRAGLPTPACGGQAQQASGGDLDEVDRHAIKVEYAPPQSDLEIEQVTVLCACGEKWTTYLPFGAFETYRSGETDADAPFLTQWRDHVHAACGLEVPGQRVGVLGMSLEAIEHLVDERGELIAERDAALAQVDSMEIHDGCTADLEAQKDLTNAAWTAHDAAAADAKALGRQRNFGFACAAVLIIAVLTLAYFAR